MNIQPRVEGSACCDQPVITGLRFTGLHELLERWWCGLHAGRRARSLSRILKRIARCAAGILRALTAELESAVNKCGQVVEQNNAWLAETIQKNTKNLQYQTCARSPLG